MIDSHVSFRVFAYQSIIFAELPIVHPAMVASGVVDGAVRGDGGGGDSWKPGGHMDRTGEQANEECH